MIGNHFNRSQYNLLLGAKLLQNMRRDRFLLTLGDPKAHDLSIVKECWKVFAPGEPLITAARRAQ